MHALAPEEHPVYSIRYVVIQGSVGATCENQVIDESGLQVGFAGEALKSQNHEWIFLKKGCYSEAQELKILLREIEKILFFEWDLEFFKQLMVFLPKSFHLVMFLLV